MQGMPTILPDLFKHFGSRAAAARAFGIKPQSFDDWLQSGFPEHQAAKVEHLTGGKYLPDMARPDLNWERDADGVWSTTVTRRYPLTSSEAA